MDIYAFLLFLHIMSLVFWLGTDVGVFTLGKFAQNPDYSIDQRMLLLKVALILDMFPRVFMVLTLPTGYQLAATLGLIPATPMITLAVWLFSGFWLAVVLLGLLSEETKPIKAKAKIVEKIIQYSLLLGLAWIGISSVIFTGPVAADWLAWKIIFYASVLAIIPFLEKAFMPAVMGFMTLPEKGSSAELEATIKSSMDKTYIWVIAIYLVVFVATYLGVAKPY